MNASTPPSVAFASAAPAKNNDGLPQIRDISPRPLSRLTYKIMGMNVIMLVVLAMSFSYISQTRENLISNEVSNFDTESRVLAVAIKREWVNAGPENPQFSSVLAAFNVNADQEVTLLDNNGVVIAKSGSLPQRRSYEESQDGNVDIAGRGLAMIRNMISVTFNLPPFPAEGDVTKLPSDGVGKTVNGLSIMAWSAPDRGLILSSASDLQDASGKKFASLQILRRDMGIEEAFLDTRLAVFRFVVISLVMTTSFSLYLASLIGHPLRNLALAAEAFRLNKGRGVEIPDLSERNDEIGELSEAMRDMAEALKSRLTAIESFASDVAHELKNPLTSMKSAVETLPKVKREEDRDRLTEIIHHDLQRMDRLISDISQASRLDAELSRDVLIPLDIRHILNPLIDAKKDPMARGIGDGIGAASPVQDERIQRQGFDQRVMVMGQAGRLAQVFDNLISNALSFSPEGCAVTVTIDGNDERVRVMVDDEGQGIPESRLEKIFDRFYSERPTSENFGMHSGLGLSIAKQIVESHGGTIHAENRKDTEGKVIGARFVVRLRGPNLT